MYSRLEYLSLLLVVMLMLYVIMFTSVFIRSSCVDIYRYLINNCLQWKVDAGRCHLVHAVNVFSCCTQFTC